jgi:hypothetical protein
MVLLGETPHKGALFNEKNSKRLKMADFGGG